MPGLNRNGKTSCDKCGKQTTKRNNVRHKTRFSNGTLYCTQYPNFSTTYQLDLNYHLAKKHATPRVKITHTCTICFEEISGFHALRQHKTSEHGIQMKPAEIDVNILLADNDADLKEEVQACQHFLVDSELGRRRHCVFNFTMSAFYNPFIKKKLDLVFKGLNCASKVNLAFGLVLKNVEEGSCRYFHAHENNTVMEKSKLVCRPDEITNLKEKLQKMDFVYLCTRERANSK